MKWVIRVPPGGAGFGVLTDVAGENDDVLHCRSPLPLGGPSLRRDPAKDGGRRLQLPACGQLAHKARSGAGSRACAATRSGAAWVAAGNRTDLGDPSVGGIGASERIRTETHSRTIVLAGSSETAGPMSLRRRAASGIFHFRPPASSLAEAVRDEDEQGCRPNGTEWRRIRFDGGRCDPTELRGVGMKVIAACFHGAKGTDRRRNSRSRPAESCRWSGDPERPGDADGKRRHGATASTLHA